VRGTGRDGVVPVVLAAVLCAAFVPLLAGPAQASSTASDAAMLRRLVPKILHRALPGVRGRAGSLESLAQAVKPSGSRHVALAYIPIRLHRDPYRVLGLVAESSDAGAQLEFVTGRQVVNTGKAFAIQAYAWDATLPSSDIHFGKNLRSISIHTGTDLGSYGSVDLRMTSATHRSQHTVICHKTGKKLATSSQARPAFTGAIDFRAGVPFLPPSIQESDARGSAFSVTRTGNHCPRQHHHHSSCYPESQLEASDGRGDSFRASDFGDGIEVDRSTATGRVRAVSVAAVFTGRSSLQRGHGAIHVVAPSGQPLIRGSLTFVRGDWGGVSIGAHCTTKSYGYDGYGGALVTTFDAGTLTLHGSSLTGRYVKVVHSGSSPPH
jgi:hypothetical protein